MNIVPYANSRSLLLILYKCVSFNSKLLIDSSPSFPFGKDNFVFYVCKSVSVL